MGHLPQVVPPKEAGVTGAGGELLLEAVEVGGEGVAEVDAVEDALGADALLFGQPTKFAEAGLEDRHREVAGVRAVIDAELDRLIPR